MLAGLRDEPGESGVEQVSGRTRVWGVGGEPGTEGAPIVERGSATGWRAVATHAERRSALRWDPALPWRERVLQALRAPVWAGITVFVVVVVLAVCVAAVRTGATASAGDEVIAEAQVSEGDPETDPASGGVPDTVPASGTAADHDASLWIHVVGEVRDPGLVELASASRVADAIAAAGGATDAAELGGLNLARLLADGEQVRVPDAEEAAAAKIEKDEGSASGVLGAPPSAQTVSLSRASVAELETLPRIGPALAARILEWREANGGFATIEQLLEVPGIGDKTLDGLREYVVP